jgi:AcrR family transcriptional regulator
MDSQRDPLSGTSTEGGSSRRGRSKQATRQALVTAANELFDEVGYTAALTSDIARRADVAQATLFRYFGTKADLALTHLRAALEDAVLAVHRQPPSDGPYTATLAALDRAPMVESLNSPALRLECQRLDEQPELWAHLCWLSHELKEQLGEAYASRVPSATNPALSRALASAVVDVMVRELRATPASPGEHPVRLACAVSVLRPLFAVAGPDE